MGRLNPELVNRLIHAAIKLDFYSRRQILLLHIPRDFQSMMPWISDRMGDQLVSDLNHLNEAGILRDGSDPLEIWLKNAVDATGGVQEETLFREALAELDRLKDLGGIPKPISRNVDAGALPFQNPSIAEIIDRGGEHSNPLAREQPHFIPVMVPWWMGEGILRVTISRWLKKPGERVQIDEPLVEIATEKIDVEIPSPATGYLRYVDVLENQVVEIGVRVALIEEGLCYINGF